MAYHKQKKKNWIGLDWYLEHSQEMFLGKSADWLSVFHVTIT